MSPDAIAKDLLAKLLDAGNKHAAGGCTHLTGERRDFHRARQRAAHRAGDGCRGGGAGGFLRRHKLACQCFSTFNQ